MLLLLLLFLVSNEMRDTNIVLLACNSFLFAVSACFSVVILCDTKKSCAARTFVWSNRTFRNMWTWTWTWQNQKVANTEHILCMLCPKRWYYDTYSYVCNAYAFSVFTYVSVSSSSHYVLASGWMSCLFFSQTSYIVRVRFFT